MSTVLAREAFSVGARQYFWRDVVIAAILRGDWRPFAEQVRGGLALVQQAEDADEAPSDQDLDAAGEEFRYARDLETAEDMEAWLERWDLTVEDWMGYLERSLLRESGSEDVDQVLARYPPSDADVAENIWTEAVCSGELARFAETLASRAALGERAAASGDDGKDAAPQLGLERFLGTFPDSLAQSGLAELLGAEPREKLEELTRLELAFESVSRHLLTPAAIREQLERNRLDWIRLDLRDVRFASEEAAREAALCLRQDGEPLETVAARARVPVEPSRLHLSEADPDLRAHLLGAQPGQLLGPFSLEDGFHLFHVCEGTMPSEEDPDFRQLAADALLTGLIERETQSRVRWHDRL